MHRDEEIRPYWGESAEVLEGPIDPGPPRVESHTLAEWRELKIADGLCPLPGCAGNLDEDFFCSLCGNTSLPHQPIDAPDPVELPFFALVLHMPDEYAPAEVGAVTQRNKTTQTFNEDRRVHASHPAGEEIVRYDRRGHWYVEMVTPSPDAGWRGRVTIDQAVMRAIELEEDGLGRVHLGLRGGGMFDGLYRRVKRV